MEDNNHNGYFTTSDSNVAAEQAPWRFGEGASLEEIEQHLLSTYDVGRDGYYVSADDKNIQTFDYWKSLGSLETTARDMVIKYVARYGRKGGRNRKDLLKAAHYLILMMHCDWEARTQTQVDSAVNDLQNRSDHFKDR